MGWEYRIVLENPFRIQEATDALLALPCANRPSDYPDEVWLCSEQPQCPDVRFFPREFGFFMELTRMNSTMSEALSSWSNELNTLGGYVVIDNDTEETSQQFPSEP